MDKRATMGDQSCSQDQSEELEKRGELPENGRRGRSSCVKSWHLPKPTDHKQAKLLSIIDLGSSNQARFHRQLMNSVFCDATAEYVCRCG